MTCTDETKYLRLTLVTYVGTMIVTFGSKETQKIWQGERVGRFSVDLQQTARRKMRMLNNSQSLTDLQIPPSNRLEKMKGKLRELYSIRVNSQWRLTFRWDRGSAFDVELVDYH